MKSEVESGVTGSEKKIKDFADLLDTLGNTEDKKKLLWKEAYKNAIEDRLSASILVDDLLINIQGSMGNHATHGVLAARYLERMSKSNDQILKLAEIISKEQEKDDHVDNDDIYSAIKG